MKNYFILHREFWTHISEFYFFPEFIACVCLLQQNRYTNSTLRKFQGQNKQWFSSKVLISACIFKPSAALNIEQTFFIGLFYIFSFHNSMSLDKYCFLVWAYFFSTAEDMIPGMICRMPRSTTINYRKNFFINLIWIFFKLEIRCTIKLSQTVLIQTFFEIFALS
jgi:hypothetical protein